MDVRFYNQGYPGIQEIHVPGRNIRPNGLSFLCGGHRLASAPRVTKSYADLCALLGKTIQHIPSTYNKVDLEKIRLAKERAKKLYQLTFGEMPKEIWEYPRMYDSLGLAKVKLKIRTFSLFGILAFVVLTMPSYFLLRPIYMNINSLTFMTVFIGVSVLAFVGLRSYNLTYLKRVASGFNKITFPCHLQPSDLFYLQTQSLEKVMHETISRLIDANKIRIVKDDQLEKVEGVTPCTLEEYQALEVLSTLGKVTILPF